MDANADNAAEEIHSHPPPEVSVTRHSPTESVVQALVADQSVLSTLSQAILSVIKQDLPDTRSTDRELKKPQRLWASRPNNLP